MTRGIRPVELLLIEDSPTDVLLMREALLEVKVINNLHVVENGDHAMAFLRREPPFADALRPDLILLDLHIPGRSGHEVLQEIKGDEGLRTIPVVILTTSSAISDVELAYARHANCFITKPPDIESLVNVVRSVEQLWLCVVTVLPDDT